MKKESPFLPNFPPSPLPFSVKKDTPTENRWVHRKNHVYHVVGSGANSLFSFGHNFFAVPAYRCPLWSIVIFPLRCPNISVSKDIGRIVSGDKAEIFLSR